MGTSTVYRGPQGLTSVCTQPDGSVTHAWVSAVGIVGVLFDLSQRAIVEAESSWVLAGMEGRRAYTTETYTPVWVSHLDHFVGGGGLA